MKIISLLACVSLFGISIYTQTDESNVSFKDKIQFKDDASSLAQDDLKQSIARGKLLYTETCIACHLGNGEGVKGTFPPLAKADYLLKQPDKAIAAVKYGLKGKITVNGIVYNTAMANPGLDNQEIADVMNYIFNSWGNKSPIGLVTAKKVDSIKP